MGLGSLWLGLGSLGLLLGSLGLGLWSMESESTCVSGLMVKELLGFACMLISGFRLVARVESWTESGSFRVKVLSGALSGFASVLIWEFWLMARVEFWIVLVLGLASGVESMVALGLELASSGTWAEMLDMLEAHWRMYCSCCSTAGCSGCNGIPASCWAWGPGLAVFTL